MVGTAERIFKREPLSFITQEEVDSGNAFFNLYFFVHTLLYDFPGFVENPDKVEEILIRWKKGKATNFDRTIVNVIRNRLLVLGAKDVLKALKLETDSSEFSEFIPSPDKVFGLLTGTSM